VSARRRDRDELVCLQEILEGLVGLAIVSAHEHLAVRASRMEVLESRRRPSICVPTFCDLVPAMVSANSHQSTRR